MSNSDIQHIKSQLNKIKILIKAERQTDRNIIRKLTTQLKQINSSVSKLEKMANRIKGGKVRGLRGGSGCPFIQEDNKGGKKRGKKYSKKRGGTCSYHKKKKKRGGVFGLSKKEKEKKAKKAKEKKEKQKKEAFQKYKEKYVYIGMEPI